MPAAAETGLDAPFCFVSSENYIFGKFDAFCKRLEKLDDMLIAMENLSGLQKIKIEVRRNNRVIDDYNTSNTPYIYCCKYDVKSLEC